MLPHGSGGTTGNTRRTIKRGRKRKVCKNLLSHSSNDISKIHLHVVSIELRLHRHKGGCVSIASDVNDIVCQHYGHPCMSAAALRPKYKKKKVCLFFSSVQSSQISCSTSSKSTETHQVYERQKLLLLETTRELTLLHNVSLTCQGV